MSLMSLLSWLVLSPVVVFGLIWLFGNYAWMPLLALACWVLVGGQRAPKG